jgi:hypothetical protein
MAQTSFLKSTAITNLDATPVVEATAGEGAVGRLHAVTGTVSSVSLDAALSTYAFVRVPTTAKVTQVLFESAAMSGGKVQLGLYYSTSTTDGTPAASRGLVVTSSGSTSQVNFFSGDIDCTSAVVQANYTYAGTALNTAAVRNMPLWQAAGLTSNPGGNFDIVGTCHTTAVTTGAAMVLTAYYVT